MIINDKQWEIISYTNSQFLIANLHSSREQELLKRKIIIKEIHNNFNNKHILEEDIIYLNKSAIQSHSNTIHMTDPKTIIPQSKLNIRLY